MINPFLRMAFKIATKRKVYVEKYPNLPKDEVYIFASTHSFDEDVLAGLANLDRHAWLLNGTTHQIHYNPQMYAAWLNGMIYVNRLDAGSRKESVIKMIRILKSGSSIFMFPEGGGNNTENLLVQPLFAGPWILAKETNCKVVPFVSFNEHNSDEIYIRVGDPIDIGKMNKEEGIRKLRDALATEVFEIMCNHASKFNRCDKDMHIAYMEERRKEYLRVKWRDDVWDEEITFYKNSLMTYEEDVIDFVEVADVDHRNAFVLAPLLVKNEQYKKYNFLRYMHNNWDG